jgi:hypothetical protein
VVDARTRRVVLLDARSLEEVADAPAGVGPTDVVAGGRFVYVADTAGEALLVFELRDGGIAPIRYVWLPAAPGAMAIDRETAYRVWVALPARNEVIGLPAHGRPRPIERFAAVEGARRLEADPATGRVTVFGAVAVQEVEDPTA